MSYIILSYLLMFCSFFNKIILIISNIFLLKKIIFFYYCYKKKKVAKNAKLRSWRKFSTNMGGTRLYGYVLYETMLVVVLWLRITEQCYYFGWILQNLDGCS